jgi:glycosyltransferase involved in cell wall biosynthesis
MEEGILDAVDTYGLGVSSTGRSVCSLGGRLRITLVVSGFPTLENPRRGIFNMRTRQALSSFAEVTVLFLRAWTPGRQLGRVHEVEGVTIVTAPQLPTGEVTGRRFIMAANILLFRKLGWRAVAESVHGADIIHSVDGVIGMVVSEWASRAGKRHVTQLIGSDVNIIIPRLPRVVARGWEKHLQGAICNSGDLATRFTALYPTVPNVRAIPRGVDPGIFNPVGVKLGPQATQGPVRFGFYGGFKRHAFSPPYVKGGPILLSAWKAAEQTLASAGASLLLAGPNCHSNLVASWRQGLRYPERVHIVGEVSPEKMPGYLRAVDAVLVPSFAEGLPNVCLEAAACGRGVLASAVGGIPDVVVHNETGLILDSGDVLAWATALAACSNQPERLHEMGRRGRARVQLLFDSRHYGSRLRAVYEDSLKLSLIDGSRS